MNGTATTETPTSSGAVPAADDPRSSSDDTIPSDADAAFDTGDTIPSDDTDTRSITPTGSRP